MMIIRSDDRQALARSLAEIAGMGRLEFKNGLVSDCDSLLVRLRDRILSSDCCVYVLIHHICRRLELDDGNFSSSNLRRLLKTENAFSAFLRNHGITFKITDEAIVPFLNGRRINLASIRNNYGANLRRRLFDASCDADVCVNGFALGDSIQKNSEFSYYSECPELIRMFDCILPSLCLLHDYQELSHTYLISYPVNITDVILDSSSEACFCNKVERLVGCYLERLFYGLSSDELINADPGNVVLRVGDEVDLSGRGCVVRKYENGRFELLQDNLSGMKCI